MTDVIYGVVLLFAFPFGLLVFDAAGSRVGELVGRWMERRRRW